MNSTHSNVPVFVLCGGLGTRFREETEARPKPMITIGNRPILWHIMRKYSQHGFRRFVLCLGYKAEVIKSYFLNYASMNSDFTVDLMTNNATVHSVDHDQDWTVTLAYTGELTMTGARVAKAAPSIWVTASISRSPTATASPTLNLADEFEFHLKAKAESAPFWGSIRHRASARLKLAGTKVEEFSEKPDFHEQWINGGYFLFPPRFPALSRS